MSYIYPVQKNCIPFDHRSLEQMDEGHFQLKKQSSQ